MHVPVLLSSMVTQLAPRTGEVYIDGTFGEGGYSRAILSSCPCSVIACDRDPAAVPYAQALVEQFGARFQFFPARFSEIPLLLARTGLSSVEGMVFDLGVSSLQIDTPERGFSFQKEGPLDMRMGPDSLSAIDLVNTFPEEKIAEILWRYGEERKARLLARKIVEVRQKKPIKTTLDLQRIVVSTLPGFSAKDPATRTFQAFRIFINEELHELQQALTHAEQYIKPGGRLVVVSFHSLEDRLVKQFLKGPGASSDPISGQSLSEETPFKNLLKKPIMPSREEKQAYLRARSARMRVGVRRG
jgi:16S rRNA (cytosine1402-N4)-methyltransferase